MPVLLLASSATHIFMPCCRICILMLPAVMQHLRVLILGVVAACWPLMTWAVCPGAGGYDAVV